MSSKAKTSRGSRREIASGHDGTGREVASGHDCHIGESSQRIVRRSGKRYKVRSMRKIGITPRRERAVVAAFLNRAMRSDHFDGLFASVTTRNKCLRLMFDHSYLDRAFPEGSPFGAPVYHVGKAGVPVAVAALAGNGLELTSEDVVALSRRPPLSQIEHTLRCAGVYAAFLLQEKEAKADISFLPERLVRIEYEARPTGSQHWRRRCFAPDGALIFRRQEHVSPYYLVFLEIDLATVPLARVAKDKCQAFKHVVAGGLHVARTGIQPAALAIVTVSEARLGHLRRVAENAGCVLAATGSTSPVLLTTFEEIDRHGPSAKWKVVGEEDRMTMAEFIRQRGGEPCSA